MVGAGLNVFAVWTFALANADAKGCVELNPKYLAFVLGGSDEEIAGALTYLTAPDPESRSQEEEGRRMVREGQFLYRIVNYSKYRSVRDRDKQREFQREWDRKNRPSGYARSKGQVTIKDATQPKANGKAGFERFWKVWPRKEAKKDAMKAWSALKPDTDLRNTIIAAIDRQRQGEQWQKDGGKYIPLPASWLRGERWNDEAPQQAEENPLFHQTDRKEAIEALYFAGQIDDDEYKRRLEELEAGD